VIEIRYVLEVFSFGEILEIFNLGTILRSSLN
jgi:hypothetical protein